MKSFEWRYFHFVGSEIALNLILHKTDIFGLIRKSYMSLCVLKKGDDPKYFKREFTSLEDEEKVLTNFGGKVKLNVAFDGCYLTVFINKGLKPISINKGVLYEIDGKKSDWVVDIPFGTFEAELKLGDIKNNFSGVTYQDHQWGSLKIQDFVSQWIWGHFSNNYITVVFFHILTQKGDIVDRVIVGSKDSYSTSCFLEIDSLKYMKENSEFYKKLYELDLKLVENQIKVKVNLIPRNLMRSRILEKHADFTSTYLRWASSADVFVEGKRRKLNGLIEYLRIDSR